MTENRSGAASKNTESIILIPLKKNMDVYEDVLGLVREKRVKFEPYSPPPPKPPVDPKPTHVPQEIRQREKKRQKTLLQRKDPAPPPPADKVLVRSEIACISDLRTWSSCPVPLHVTVNREHYADGHTDTWMLIDTKDTGKRACARDDYRLRTGIEERHRQLKCLRPHGVHFAQVFVDLQSSGVCGSLLQPAAVVPVEDKKKHLRNPVSIDEVYLFCQKTETLNAISLYQSLTQNKKLELTRVRLKQFISNIVSYENGKRFNITLDKETYV